MQNYTETQRQELLIRPTGRVIYEVSLHYVGTLNTIREREPSIIYFSNLRKAVDSVTAELAMNNWPPKVNYTAVYRGVKQRGFYNCDFDVANARVFRVRVVPRVLNPALPRLGIDENPTFN